MSNGYALLHVFLQISRRFKLHIGCACFRHKAHLHYRLYGVAKGLLLDQISDGQTLKPRLVVVFCLSQESEALVQFITSPLWHIYLGTTTYKLEHIATGTHGTALLKTDTTVLTHIGLEAAIVISGTRRTV